MIHFVQNQCIVMSHCSTALNQHQMTLKLKMKVNCLCLFQNFSWALQTSCMLQRQELGQCIIIKWVTLHHGQSVSMNMTFRRVEKVTENKGMLTLVCSFRNSHVQQTEML